MGRPPFDPSKYIGKKYGRLTLIEFDHSEYLDIRHRNHFFKCRCDCGTEKIINLKQIIGNKPSTVSCGCYNREINAARIKYLNYSHGLSNHRLRRIWDGMKSRCYKTTNLNFCDYGARGIRVCDEWLHDFKTFYDWAITHGYADNLSIDRIDHEGNYVLKTVVLQMINFNKAIDVITSILHISMIIVQLERVSSTIPTQYLIGLEFCESQLDLYHIV